MQVKKFIPYILFCFSTSAGVTYAQSSSIEFQYSPIPSDLRTLDYRLDNLEASVSKLQYVLNHLDKNMVMLQVVPLSEAHTSFDDVINYAVSGVTEALNLNFTDFRHTLSESSEFYSLPAYESLQDFLKQNGITEQTQERKISNSAVIMGPALITSAKPASMPHPNIPNKKRDAYTWDIEIPVFMQTHESDKLVQTMRKLVKVKVVRSSVEHSPEQMIIDTIQFEEYGNL